MKELTPLQSAVMMAGGVLVVLGAAAYMFLPVAAFVAFAVGAVAFSYMQLQQSYDGRSFTVRRLRRLGGEIGAGPKPPLRRFINRGRHAFGRNGIEKCRPARRVPSGPGHVEARTYVSERRKTMSEEQRRRGLGYRRVVADKRNGAPCGRRKVARLTDEDNRGAVSRRRQPACKSAGKSAARDHAIDIGFEGVSAVVVAGMRPADEKGNASPV